MIGNFERYDMARRPNRQWHILRPVAWLLSLPDYLTHKAKVDKSGMPKGLKPPYFLLCNHNAFMDFKIMTMATFPRRANYVVAIDGFIGRGWLLRAVGCICNRKFAKSYNLVINMLHAKNNGDIVVLFPEARYSLCGTSAILPDSLGKMIKKMDVPVVTLIMHGHHVNSPFWNTGNRKVKPVESELKQLLTVDEIKALTVEEINERVNEAFQYDDYAWQKERGIRVKNKKRAEGLHKVLYQCPACKAEYKMSSCGTQLKCEACGKTWEMTELGELQAINGETEFTHIPAWYEWERENVRREVQDGTYSFKAQVRVESLPNDKRFIVFDNKAELVHDMNGFHLAGTLDDDVHYDVSWPAKTLYSCHIEYDYFGRGDCVDLNTNTDTFYLFPEGGDFSVTKISLATEELWKSAN